MVHKSLPTAIIVMLVAIIGFGAGAYYAKRMRPAFSPSSNEDHPSIAIDEPNPFQPPAKEPIKNGPSGYSLFLVASGDSGKSGKLIGCGDSLVGVGTQAATVKDALTALFSIKSQMYGQSGLSTALYNAALTVGKITLSRVDISGSFNLGGECDDPRAEEQINATVHQFLGYEKTVVYVNGKTLHDALSLK